MAKLVSLNDSRLAGSRKKKSTPGDFSPLAMYGDRRVFLKSLEEGFVHYAAGNGVWVNGTCIVAIFVFYKPDTGSVRTLETRKYDDGFRKSRSQPHTNEYSAAEFEVLCREHRLNIGEKKSLVALLESWSE